MYLRAVQVTELCLELFLCVPTSLRYYSRFNSYVGSGPLRSRHHTVLHMHERDLLGSGGDACEGKEKAGNQSLQTEMQV